MFPWFLWNWSKEDIERRSALQAKAANDKFFSDIEKKVPQLLDELGIFHYMVIPSLSKGVKIRISFKEYPNCYAIVDLTQDTMDHTITFKFYIHENKWQTFEIPMIHFLSLIGLTDNKYALITKEQLLDLVRRTVEIGQYNVVPYRYHYEEDENCTFDFSLDDVAKMMHPEVVWFTVDEDRMSIMKNHIMFDQEQWFCINMMKIHKEVLV